MKRTIIMGLSVFGLIVFGGVGEVWSANLCTDGPIFTTRAAKHCCDQYPNIGLDEETFNCCVNNGGSLPSVCPVIPTTANPPTEQPPSASPVGPKGPAAPSDLPTLPLPLPPNPAPFPDVPCPSHTDSECASLDTNPNDCEVIKCVNTGANPDPYWQCVPAHDANCVPRAPQGDGCKEDSQCASLETDPNDCSAPKCVISTTPGVNNYCSLEPISGCEPPSEPTPSTSTGKLACDISCLSKDCDIALDEEGKGVSWQVNYSAPSSLSTIAFVELTQLSGPQLSLPGVPDASSGATLITPKMLTRKTMAEAGNKPFLVETARPKSMFGEYLPKFSLQVAFKDAAGATLGAAECKNQTALEANGGGCGLVSKDNQKPPLTSSLLLALGLVVTPLGVLRLTRVRSKSNRFGKNN
jgi:hypothetical protein